MDAWQLVWVYEECSEEDQFQVFQTGAMTVMHKFGWDCRGRSYEQIAENDERQKLKIVDQEVW